jgi:hypothetical protein
VSKSQFFCGDDAAPRQPVDVFLESKNYNVRGRHLGAQHQSTNTAAATTVRDEWGQTPLIFMNGDRPH